MTWFTSLCFVARSFFTTTPSDLTSSGLYSEIAIALHVQPFREVRALELNTANSTSIEPSLFAARA